MRPRHLARTAIHALRVHPSRSALTVLGIVIGITAIILVVSVGRGAQDLILHQVRSFGSQSIFVEPGREPKGPTDFAELLTDSLKSRDAAALANPANVPSVTKVAALVAQVVTAQHESETTRVQLRGTSATFPDIFDLALDQGAFFTEDDVARRASVAVIGDEVRTQLFGASDAMGATIQVKGRPFQVIGTLPRKGDSSIIPYDHLVLIPVTTAQDYLLGIDHYHFIAVRIADGANTARAKADIEATLREQHRIVDPAKDDFHVMTQEDAVARIGIIGTILTTLLTSIAAIALVVGGIGIMNIMFVAVTERTREIGLRKAIGATNSDILRQFLAEAVALTVLGGVIGVMLGSTLAALIAFILRRTVASGWGFTLPISAMLLGVGVSTVIGIIFGLYPAKKASRKSPMEALRYE